MNEGLTRECSLLDLMLTSKEGHGCESQGNIGCSDHEMELTTRRGGDRTKSSTTTLDFRTVDFNFFRDLLGRIQWSMALDRALGELINIQRSLPPSLRKVPPDKQEMKGSQKEGFMNEEGAPNRTQT